MEESATQGVDSEAATQKRKSKTRSNVWDHFHKFIDEDGSMRARCIYCEKTLAAGGKNGTSTLNYHVHSCKSHPHTIETNQRLVKLQSGAKGSIAESSKGGSSTVTYDENAIREALCKMIIWDELPFAFVEKRGFKLFMSVALPRFHIPTRFTISRDCYMLYLSEKEQLRSYFRDSNQMICLTTDTWTSIQRINYMCITAHWIDSQWKLQKRILNFCPVSSHRGDDLAWAVTACLRDWGIQRVFTITVDNASSNDVMVATLKRKLNSSNGTVLQGKFLHMRCAAHILNIVVNDGLKEITQSILRVRQAVRYVRNSPSRLAKFQSLVEQESISSRSGLCLDICTRWNSTYMMLQAACKFEEAFNRYKRVDSLYTSELESSEANGCPDYNDWANARSLSQLLQVFYDTTLRVSGSLYITSNTYVHELTDVDVSLKKSANDEDYTLSIMSRRMREKYDKYWGNIEKLNLLIFIPVVFDPRYKMDYLKHALPTMYPIEVSGKLMKMIEESLQELFNEYKTLYGKQGGNEGEKLPSPIVEENDRAKRAGDSLRNRFKKMKASRSSEENKTELVKYLSEETEIDANSQDNDENYDVLVYWRVNSARFPILSRIARDILAVPISTVASESAFSTGGRVLDSFRSSLSPRMVQALICGQDWIRAIHMSQNVCLEEDLASIEQMEKEWDEICLEPLFNEL